jgi:hypothetical protein
VSRGLLQNRRCALRTCLTLRLFLKYSPVPALPTSWTKLRVYWRKWLRILLEGFIGFPILFSFPFFFHLTCFCVSTRRPGLSLVPRRLLHLAESADSDLFRLFHALFLAILSWQPSR